MDNNNLSVANKRVELMILGFIPLLLTIGKETICDICIPSKVASTWQPCNEDKLDESFYDPCFKKGKVQMVSNYGIHQLHIFIFVLAVVHVAYCILTLVLGRFKMRWKVWENETKTVEYQYHHGKSYIYIDITLSRVGLGKGRGILDNHGRDRHECRH